MAESSIRRAAINTSFTRELGQNTNKKQQKYLPQNWQTKRQRTEYTIFSFWHKNCRSLHELLHEPITPQMVSVRRKASSARRRTEHRWTGKELMHFYRLYHAPVPLAVSLDGLCYGILIHPNK